jgi:hypothetical protein
MTRSAPWKSSGRSTAKRASPEASAVSGPEKKVTARLVVRDAAAGPGAVAARLGEEQREDVETLHVQAALGQEIGEGIGRFLRDETQHAFVHHGQGQARAGRGFGRGLKARAGPRELGRFGRDGQPAGLARDVHGRRAEGPARLARRDVAHLTHDHGRDIDVGRVLFVQDKADLGRVAGHVHHLVAQDGVAFERHQGLAREGRAELEHGRLAGPVVLLVGHDLHARAVAGGPGPEPSAGDPKTRLGRGPARGIAKGDAIAPKTRRDEGERSLAVHGPHLPRLHDARIAHRDVAQGAVGRAAQHGLPALLHELGREFGVGRGPAVGRDPDEGQGHLGSGRKALAAGDAQARIGRIGVHGHGPRGGHASASLLAHASGHGQRQGGRRSQAARQAQARRERAVLVQGAFLGENFARLELALQTAEGEPLEPLGREGPGLDPGAHFHGQVRGGRAEEPGRAHRKRYLRAGSGFAGRVHLHADAVGHELLDLEAVLAHHVLARAHSHGEGAGGGRAGQGEVQEGPARLVRGHGARIRLAAARIGHADGQRHGRRRAQVAAAQDEGRARGLAGAVDVALAKDEGPKPGGRQKRAARVQSLGVGPRGVEEQEGEVVALRRAGQDHEGRCAAVGVVRQGGPPQAVRPGRAFGQDLVLVREHGQPRSGRWREVREAGRPDEDVVARALGREADVRDAHVALAHAPLARQVDLHAVQPRPLLADALAQGQGHVVQRIAGLGQSDPFLHDAIAQDAGDGPAPALVAQEVVALRGQGVEEVVGVDAVDGQLRLIGVHGLDAQRFRAPGREVQAWIGKGRARGQVRHGHLHAQRGLGARAVQGRKAGRDAHRVARAGREGAFQGQALVRAAAQREGHGRGDADQAARLIRRDRRGEVQAQGEGRGPALHRGRAHEPQHRIDAEGPRKRHVLAERAAVYGRKFLAHGQDKVARLGGLAQPLCDEGYLVADVARGQGERHGLARLGRVDQTHVLQEVLGPDLVRETHPAREAGAHHGVGGHVGLGEAHVGDHEGRRCGREAVRLGQGRLLAGQRGRVQTNLEGGPGGQSLLGRETQRVGRYPGPLAGYFRRERQGQAAFLHRPLDRAVGGVEDQQQGVLAHVGRELAHLAAGRRARRLGGPLVRRGLGRAALPSLDHDHGQEHGYEDVFPGQRARLVGHGGLRAFGRTVFRSSLARPGRKGKDAARRGGGREGKGGGS